MTAARGQVPPGEEAGRGEHGPALVLLRHGESTANAAGLFTGVWDVPLTTRGRAQAARAASLMAAVGIRPTLLLTSPLVRAVQTVEILREKGGWESTTMLCPELTERGYGALTGLRKDAVADLFGAERTHHWRRGGVTERPPRLDEVTDDFARVTAATRRTADVLEAARVAESLDDVVGRVRRWYGEVLLPSLHQGESAVVVAHGNSLRALVAVIDHLADAETERLNVPTGEPLRYPVGPSGDPLPRTGTYLDPASAQAAIHAVEREGGT